MPSDEEPTEEQRFGRRLEAAADLAGVSQAVIARYVGVDKALVSRWCRGVRLPSMEQLHKVADITGRDAEELRGGVPLVPRHTRERRPASGAQKLF